MKCIVLAEDPSFHELFPERSGSMEILRVQNPSVWKAQRGDAWFDLRDEAWDTDLYQAVPGPVFIAGVTGTLSAAKAPAHVVRFNGWPGMLQREKLECAADAGIRKRAEEIFSAMGKSAEWLPDEPGFVSPRVLAMIINEAWFTWEEGVSSRQEIDTAMQLGTNYPCGPFAWGEKIGLKKIVHLLEALASRSKRYQVSKSLLEASQA